MEGKTKKRKEIELYLKSRRNSDWKSTESLKKSKVLVGVKVRTQQPHRGNANAKKWRALQLKDIENFKMKPLRETEANRDYRERIYFLKKKLQKIKVLKSLWGLPPLIQFNKIQYFFNILKFQEQVMIFFHFFSANQTNFHFEIWISCFLLFFFLYIFFFNSNVNQFKPFINILF